MRKWGIIVSLLYVLILFAFLVPAFRLLASSSAPSLSDFAQIYKSSITWIIVGAFVAAQFVLLALTVDTSWRPLKPQTSIVASAVITGLLLAIVTVVIGLALFLAIKGENAIPDFQSIVPVLAPPLILWLMWGILFYLLYRDSADPVTRALAWLFRGSVLELLVAVPTHVVVRRRDDCCAPMVTGFGITSGIAIMLLSFGPTLVLLFKKRIEKYSESRLVSK
jgi:hypothetical protein